MMRKNVAGKQRGVGLLGLIIVMGGLGFCGLVAAKSLPLWNEYFAIKRALAKIEVDGDTDAASARRSFEKYADIDRISTIKPEDIEWTKGPKGMKGAFEYDAKVDVAGNVSLSFAFKSE